MPQLDHLIFAERQRRLSLLWQKSYSDLQALPEASSEVVQFDETKVTFTTLREQRAENELLLLVRSDRPLFLGIGSMGATEGLVVSGDGSIRAALNEDITDILG